jgi:hypothetical protein
MITKIFGSLQGDFGLKLSSIPKQPQQHFSILFSISKNLLQIICIFCFGLNSKCHKMYVSNKLRASLTCALKLEVVFKFLHWS